MSFWLVNKTKALCDIDLVDGSRRVLRPFGRIKLGEVLSLEQKRYYGMFRALGIVVEEEKKEEVEIKPTLVGLPEDVSFDNLMKLKAVELKSLCSQLDIKVEEGMPKREMARKILEVV